MKVLAINGSPHANGNTALLLNKALEPARVAGFETKMIHIGGQNIHGCRACGACYRLNNRKCVCNDDILNALLEDVWQADALILGTPSYFSDMTPELKAFIDRVGYVSRANGGLLRHKIGAAVIAQRRAGGESVQASIHHMFLMSEMIIPGSTYWNFGLGAKPGQVASDTEALDNMQNLGDNIVWLLNRIKGSG